MWLENSTSESEVKRSISSRGKIPNCVTYLESFFLILVNSDSSIFWLSLIFMMFLKITGLDRSFLLTPSLFMIWFNIKINFWWCSRFISVFIFSLNLFRLSVFLFSNIILSIIAIIYFINSLGYSLLRECCDKTPENFSNGFSI